VNMLNGEAIPRIWPSVLHTYEPVHCFDGRALLRQNTRDYLLLMAATNKLNDAEISTIV